MLVPAASYAEALDAAVAEHSRWPVALPCPATLLASECALPRCARGAVQTCGAKAHHANWPNHDTSCVEATWPVRCGA
eukprot:1478220-Prymnesium_polylepis.1